MSTKSIIKNAEFFLKPASKKKPDVSAKEVLSLARMNLKQKVLPEDVNQISPIRLAMMLTTRLPRTNEQAIKVLTTWYHRQKAKNSKSCKG